jgi:hypothetical protein
MFYKLIDEETKELSEGPCVHSAEYFLSEDTKNSHEYPIDGWYWFDTEEDAKAFFGL